MVGMTFMSIKSVYMKGNAVTLNNFTAVQVAGRRRDKN